MSVVSIAGVLHSVVACGVSNTEDEERFGVAIIRGIGREEAHARVYTTDAGREKMRFVMAKCFGWLRMEH